MNKIMQFEKSMDSDPFRANDPNSINLDDYFPYSNNYNTVMYVHKRFQKDPPPKKEKPKKKKMKNTLKEDKAVSCDIKLKRELHDEAVVNQTIKFAKELAPFIIPPSDSGEVVYTVKACNKHRTKGKKSQECKHETERKNRHEIKIDKKSRAVIDTYRKDKAYGHSCSDLSQSTPNNTLDDLNNSLSYTLTNTSDNKHKPSRKRKTREPQKFAMSESLEGLAEINDVGETKIKLQLMSEKEKEFLVESLRNPILDSVQDCLSKFNNAGMREEIKSVQRSLRNNSAKLDNILERLVCIEKYFARKAMKSPKHKSPRVSKLEQLGEDLGEKVYSSEEELPKLDTSRKHDAEARNDRVENFGGGEVTVNASTSVGVRTDRPNRLPARFCWTSTDPKMI